MDRNFNLKVFILQHNACLKPKPRQKKQTNLQNFQPSLDKFSISKSCLEAQEGSTQPLYSTFPKRLLFPLFMASFFFFFQSPGLTVPVSLYKIFAIKDYIQTGTFLLKRGLKPSVAWEE